MILIKFLIFSLNQQANFDNNKVDNTTKMIEDIKNRRKFCYSFKDIITRERYIECLNKLNNDFDCLIIS